jgi:hypothetical protein
MIECAHVRVYVLYASLTVFPVMIQNDNDFTTAATCSTYYNFIYHIIGLCIVFGT